MAAYRTGTVAVTSGSRTVTGSGTLWAVTVSPGDEFTICDANALPTGGRYEVETVNSNTSITLVQNYQGATASGLAYAVMNMAGNQSVPQFANRLSQFFDKQQATLNAPGVNVIKVGGTTFSPDAVARQLEFIAGTGVTLTPSVTGKTVTVAGTAASEAGPGVVELATTAETQAGTDTERAIVPASLHKKQWKTYLAQHFQRLGSETSVYSLVSLGSGVVLAGTHPTGKVCKSTDSGATWTEIQRLGSEMYVYSLASVGSGVVLAGTGQTGKVYNSMDSGATWTEIQRLGSETMVYSLVSLGSGVVLAGTGETGKVYKSRDRGARWT